MSDRFKRILQVPGLEDAHRVRPEQDAAAAAGLSGLALEDGDMVAMTREANRRSETGKAGADDEDVQGHNQNKDK